MIALAELGNLQRVIDGEEGRQKRRRDILAMYPDASEIYGEFHARSAAKDAKHVGFLARDDGGEDRLVAYARVMPAERRAANEYDLPVHVEAGSLSVERALYLLRTKHPEAFAKLIEVLVDEDNREPPF